MTEKTNKNNTAGTRFYDIHMHVFNLSHAGLMAFINRYFLNNALQFNDLLDGKYFKILRHYLFKKGHTPEESRRLMINRIWKVSLGVIILLAWAFLWFCIVPGLLEFEIAKSGAWDDILSWIMYVCGFLFIPVLLFLLWKVLKMLFKKLFLPKKVSRGIPRSINVLSIFENDLAHQLRYLELDYVMLHKDIRDYIFNAGDPGREVFYGKIRELWNKHGQKLNINGQEVDKVVLTPLMMNFNSKGFDMLDKTKVHYNMPPRKLIIEQLVDLVNGIKGYCIPETHLGLMEVFPFMGVNPGTYNQGGAVKTGVMVEVPEELGEKVVFLEVIDVLVFVKQMTDAEQKKLLAAIPEEEVKKEVEKALAEFHVLEFKADGYPVSNTFPKMLDKYFGDYSGSAEAFSKAFKEYFIEGKARSWRDIRGHFFSGIKVYPPLGFDPFPLEEPTEEERARVRNAVELERLRRETRINWINTHYLYFFCEKKNIPITTHCSDGGFVIMEERWSRKRANPEYWQGVLHYYKKLRLNFGHFGVQLRSTKNGWGDWNRTIIDIILNDEFPNVFADISDLGASRKKYAQLGAAMRDAVWSHSANEDEYRENWDKLCRNLLFGTDFMVHLFHTDSYREYIKIWERAPLFSEEEKVALASANPHRYLFGEAEK